MEFQTLEADLMAEFEAELQKVEEIKLSNPQSLKLNSPALKEFFESFLIKEFPPGELNKVIEKNLAIYAVTSSIDSNLIIQKYKAKGWRCDGILGWIKKVKSKELLNFNLLEILKWANQYYQEALPLLEKAKEELAEALPIETVPEILEKPKKEINWIIKPFLRPGTISFLSSPPGKGKTWLSINAALCAASGIPFLQKFETRPTKVLYLDYENFDLMQSRLSMLLNGLDKKPQEFSDLHILSTVKRHTEIFAALRKTILSEHYELVIIDPLRDYTEIDENDSKTVSYFINDLRRLAQETDVCLLLLHHESKGSLQGEALNKLRGSTALTGAADCVMQIQNDGEHLILTHSKSKGSQSETAFYCNIFSDEQKYSLIYAGLASELETTKGLTFLKVWLKDNSITLFSYSEFLDAAKLANISQSSAKRAISQAARLGIIRKESDKPRAKWEVYTKPEPIETIKIESKKRDGVQNE